MSTEIRDDHDNARYEITLDGALAGFAEYSVQDDRITFSHTEVGASYSGRGLARDLVRFALDDAKERGLAVLPLCSYVSKVIADDPDRYLDLVPASERPRFDL